MSRHDDCEFTGQTVQGLDQLCFGGGIQRAGRFVQEKEGRPVIKRTRQAKALTSGAGGDFRPSWSPDGRWIAFSSDRASNLPPAHGRWEHLQLADIYVVHPDGSGLKAITPHNYTGVK